MFRKTIHKNNKVSYNFSLSKKLYNVINSIRQIDNKDNIRQINNKDNIRQINKDNKDLSIYPTFNILIATIGRDTLENLIESLDQLNENDCITIVFDNNKLRKINNINKLKCNIVIINEEMKLGYWGHGIRNKYAFLLYKKDFILHADDDDSYFPGSFDKLRKLCIDPDITYIAKIMINKKFIPKPNKFKVCIGNISTQCGIIPYHYNYRSNWGNFYGGDGKFYVDLNKISRFKFINECIYNYGNSKDNLEKFNKLSHHSFSIIVYIK